MSLLPVTILPSLPEEGWMSMNRYWDAVGDCIANSKETGFDFRCPLKFAGICTPRAGKLRLAFRKQVAYPLQARLTATHGIAHILDHSYAFLLKSLPRGLKTIVTVHDLLPLRESDGLSKNAILRFRERIEWLKHADLLLSDSEATRIDLIELIGADPRKIEVLPLGAAPVDSEIKIGGLPPSIKGNFLLSVGGYMKRKNLGILPEMLRQIRLVHPAATLVRAGGLLPSELVAEFEARCGHDALIELGQVSDHLLDALYRSAKATIIPSRYEGFGLPVLEAMVRGCPVVAADATSLPEVGGDAALYFKVDEPEEAARQLLRILGAPNAWLQDLVKQGKARAAMFTWKIHFEKLLDIYARMAGPQQESSPP